MDLFLSDEIVYESAANTCPKKHLLLKAVVNNILSLVFSRKNAHSFREKKYNFITFFKPSCPDPVKMRIRVAKKCQPEQNKAMHCCIKACTIF